MVVRAIFGLALSQVFIGLSQNVYQLVFFRFLQGAISGFIASALALVSTNTPKEKIGYALGILQSSTAAGMVLGPSVGGLLADTIGYREIFFITAGLCAIGGVVVLARVEEHTIERTDGKKYTILENYRFVYHHRQLRVVGLSLVIAQAAVLMIEPVFALFVETFRTGSEYLATVAGAIFSIAGVFMVISAPWWGRRNDRLGHRRNLTLALGGVSAAYAGHVIVANLVQLGILRAFLGFVRGGVLPALYSLASFHAPVERRGAVMAIASSFTLLGNTIGPLIGGFVAGHLGISASFIAASITLLLLTLFVWNSLRDQAATATDVAKPSNLSEETTSK
jgi:DHA1 family multidrug resistance protein-like MFS transporter